MRGNPFNSASVGLTACSTEMSNNYKLKPNFGSFDGAFRAEHTLTRRLRRPPLPQGEGWGEGAPTLVGVKSIGYEIF